MELSKQLQEKKIDVPIQPPLPFKTMTAIIYMPNIILVLAEYGLRSNMSTSPYFIYLSTIASASNIYVLLYLGSPYFLQNMIDVLKQMNALYKITK